MLRSGPAACHTIVVTTWALTVAVSRVAPGTASSTVASLATESIWWPSSAARSAVPRAIVRSLAASLPAGVVQVASAAPGSLAVIPAARACR